MILKGSATNITSSTSNFGRATRIRVSATNAGTVTVVNLQSEHLMHKVLLMVPLSLSVLMVSSLMMKLHIQLVVELKSLN